ncbi:MAG: TIM barrel protein, partial [Caldilineaceae bacterium]|nr:TIM barrel protein [Caldilineaceae bacterium]
MSQNQYAFAVQLYTLRHLDNSLDELLGAVAGMGYTGVETIGNHGLDAAEMTRLLTKHKLAAISTHVGLQALEADMEGIVAFNEAIGNRVVTVPAIPQGERPDDVNGWERLGRRLDGLGKQLAESNMQLLYHNHAWEMEELEGQLALDWLMDSADPANLKLEPDLAWVARGGVDVETLLARYVG